MRREFPAKIKLAAWDRANGKCEGKNCGAKLFPGHVHYDHVIPDRLGGDPVLDNCAVLCTACHGVKTRTKDIPAIAKSKRVRRHHAGIKKFQRRPLPGTKASGWKHKMSGEWVRR